MTITDNTTEAQRTTHTKYAAPLLGLADDEARDWTLQGRLIIIRKLRRARQTEIGRGKTRSWLYDVNRHVSLCGCLRTEFELLADYLSSCADIVQTLAPPTEPGSPGNPGHPV